MSAALCLHALLSLNGVHVDIAQQPRASLSSFTICGELLLPEEYLLDDILHQISQGPYLLQ